jgi:hypothetical protein
MSAALACALPASAQAAVLYDQTANPSGGNRGSNDYEPTNDSYDDQTADDFTVPGGQSWQISQVDVLGLVGPDPPPSSVSVFLYANAGTLPGAELFRETDIVASGQPNYSIPVSGAPDLEPGTYWVSVQQNGALFSAQWYWNETSTQSGNPAAYRNPGGSSTPACTDWGVLGTCFGTLSNPDKLFKLSGTTAQFPPASPSSGAPPSNAITLGKPKLNKRQGTAQEPVMVPGPGDLALTGTGVVKQRPASASRVVSASGTVQLLVKSKGKAKKKLNKTGKAKVKVTITFTPTGGSPNSQTKTIKLKKKLR